MKRLIWKNHPPLLGCRSFSCSWNCLLWNCGPIRPLVQQSHHSLYSGWLCLSKVSGQGLSHQLLPGPFNWRCWGLNQGSFTLPSRCSTSEPQKDAIHRIAYSKWQWGNKIHTTHSGSNVMDQIQAKVPTGTRISTSGKRFSCLSTFLAAAPIASRYPVLGEEMPRNRTGHCFRLLQ